MNFANELNNKLCSDEWEIVSYYINKAQDLYNAEKYDDARESLLDAVAVARAHGEENAAYKIAYYTRFC